MNECFEHALMGAMDAIEVADADRGGAEVGGDVVK